MLRRSKNYFLLFMMAVILGAIRVFAMPWSDDMYQQPSIWPYQLPLIYPTDSVATDGTTEKPGDREKIEAITMNPNKATEASIQSGEKAFEIYCAACHGPQGKGDGPVIKRGFYPLDLTSAGVQGRTDGYIYAYIRYGGKVMMPSYRESITSGEAWDIVNFVRKLQGKLNTSNTTEEKTQ
ncbi:MAG TPA: cytochrome c [Thermodesulfobacteriota bacterium]|nr:cytochrome c [Thermodesulfobacteriota bacterium]